MDQVIYYYNTVNFFFLSFIFYYNGTIFLSTNVSICNCYEKKTKYKKKKKKKNIVQFNFQFFSFLRKVGRRLVSSRLLDYYGT